MNIWSTENDLVIVTEETIKNGFKAERIKQGIKWI